MWLATPIASDTVSSTTLRQDTPVVGAPANVSRAERAAPASHSPGSRAASQRGDSSRVAGRSTHRHTSRRTRATSIVAGSHANECVTP